MHGGNRALQPGILRLVKADQPSGHRRTIDPEPEIVLGGGAVQNNISRWDGKNSAAAERGQLDILIHI